MAGIMYHRQMTRGSYILLMELPEHQAIKVGSRGVIQFSRGYYAYVGSAMGGFKVRLNRHLRENKKPHWHIDYLLPRASIRSIILGETGDRVECTIARALSTQFSSIPGFGSTDCRCPSHLFFATGEKQMQTVTMAKLKQLAIKPRVVKIQDMRR